MNATTSTPAFREMATGLRFPEGPVAMPDGSVVLVEIERRTLSRVTADGKVRVIASLGGGPNGAAMGPGGKIYVTNNGGLKFVERPGKLFPVGQADDYTTGSIQVVDPDTGKFDTLYDACDGRRLCGPNDLVFDGAGGFWFTDLGKTRERDADRGAVYYAKADGSSIREAIFPLERPNGIGLSPDERTLYVVETPTARCWAFSLSAPGQIESANGPYRGEKGASWSVSAATRCSTRSPSTRRVTSAWRRSSAARSATSGPTAAASINSSCPTRWSPMSASAARTCVPPTPRCR